MNKIYKLFSMLSIVAILFTSCSPEEYFLGEKDVAPEDLVEGIAYKIEHDATNPNIVYLTSLMGNEYTPLWNHPQGRSQEQKVTLKMPFAGTYNVQFGVETRGGYVYGDTTTFKVDDMYSGFINDSLWTYLTGGVDKEKTWVTDNGKYGMAPGALSYANPANTVEFNNYSPNWEPSGNAFGSSDADMGWGSTMTFGLKGKASLTTHKLNEGGKDESGIFYMDIEKHTLTTTDAYILRPDNFISNAENWNKDLKILTLTENQLRIAIMRTNSEGAWWYILNYVSKDYADSYVPVEPEPTLPDGWKNDVSQTVNKSIKWVLSPETPFNWANLDGSLMNAGWTAADKYDSWTGFSASVADSYADFSLTLNSDDTTAVFVAPDGTTTSGTYSLSNNGTYTFYNVKPYFIICSGWVALSTTDANQWRITKIEKDAAGIVSGMWVGKRDPAKAEYMVYHLIPKSGSSTVDPLKAWKKALVGKTFKPDTAWFIDWMNFSFTGGWTSASTFGTDYTTNGWVWTEATSKIAQSARIKFEASGSDIKATLTQDLYDASGNVTTAGYSVSGKVKINPDIPSITFEFPLVNYTGSPASWLNTTNPKGVNYTTSLALNEWLYLPYGNATLTTIDTNGFWLGCISNSTAGGDSKDEILGFHFILAQ
jgi:hypothetical protein